MSWQEKKKMINCHYMTRKTRRIIFYLFLLLFVILVPTIILYALGYAFDFETKKIVPTGGIYLKSYPPKAEIYINENPKGKTAKFIKRLIPKTYDIKVVKENYHSWQKQLLIKPGLVTKAEDIFLIPFNPKIFLLATESEEYVSFFKEPYSLKEITEIIKRKSRNTIFNVENLNLNPDKSRFYFLSNNNLYSLELDKNNIENSVLSNVLVSNVLNYVIYKNGILYFEYFTGQIYELDVTSLKSAPFFEQVFPSFNQCKWIISNDNKKLLCQKDKSVEILWLGKVINNSISREKGDIEKIDFNEKINDVIWHGKTDEHLIIATDNSILVTELDNRPLRNTINFITTENPKIKYDTKQKTLYFLSQDRLYKTEL